MTAERAVALDRWPAVLTLPEAVEYSGTNEAAARALCELGLLELREQGATSRGWQCRREGSRHIWKIARESIDRAFLNACVEYSRSADAFARTPQPMARIGTGGRE